MEGNKMNLSIIKTYAIYTSKEDYEAGYIQCYGIDLTEGQLRWLKESGQVVVFIKEERI
jgi:hypothetical protein